MEKLETCKYTKFGVDSLSWFSFRAWTHTDCRQTESLIHSCTCTGYGGHG